MDFNSGAVSIRQIKLKYDEKEKNLRAVILLDYGDGRKLQTKQEKNPDVIIDRIKAFSIQEGHSVEYLISQGYIRIDSPAILDGGVIIFDKESLYRKVVLNKNTVSFDKVRLTRAENIALGIVRRDIGMDEVKEERDITIPRSSHVDEVKEITKEDETELTNIDEVVSEIKRLNPEAEIELGDKESDPRYYTRFFSSVPASDLKLPDGFYYSDKNGITNKHRTKSGHFVFFDVEPIVKKEEFSVEEDSPKEELTKEDNTSKEETKKISVESDGAMEVTGTSVKKTKNKIESKDHKRIRNLRIYAGALALITAGVILIHNFGSIFKKKQNDSRNNDKNNPQYEDSIDAELTTISYPDESSSSSVDESVYINTDVYNPNKFSSYGSAIGGGDSDSMEELLNQINAECFTLEPRTLENLVIDIDKPTIRIINDARNNALTNRNKLVETIDWYVKYVLEGGTMFDGSVVKSFDSLSPFAKYIVLVSGQSLLSKCTDYNYSTIYNEDGYDFYSLTKKFDVIVDRVFRELTGKSKIR